MSDATRLFQELERWNSLADEARADDAPITMRAALGWLAKVCGDELLQSAYGEDPEAGDRAGALSALSERLWLVSHLFAPVADPGNPASFPSAAMEVDRIAEGDRPGLFAAFPGKQGRPKNAYALSHWQLAALGWEEWLEGFEMDLAKRRALICDAFGVTWDAIVKWRLMLVDTLGPDIVRYRCEVARREGEGALAFGLDSAPFGAIAHDGAAYQSELRRR